MRSILKRIFKYTKLLHLLDSDNRSRDFTVAITLERLSDQAEFMHLILRRLRWLRLFGQVFRFLSGRIVQLVVVVGGGNVKIGFIDFQGLVGRSENSSIVFRAFHETGISTACFVAR